MGQGTDPADDDDEAAALTPLGEFMQRRNAELGLSVSAVAQRVGMSRATWYRISRGESSSPGVRVLRGLARVYKVRATELFTLAAHGVPAPAAPGTQASARAPEPGDAVWRCRYERVVRAGSSFAVELELQNMSNRPWQGAEVRPLIDGWIPLRDGGPHSRPLRDLDRTLPTCRAKLAATGTGEWVLARLTLQAPVRPGDWLLCLALYSEPAAHPGRGGAFVIVGTR